MSGCVRAGSVAAIIAGSYRENAERFGKSPDRVGGRRSDCGRSLDKGTARPRGRGRAAILRRRGCVVRKETGMQTGRPLWAARGNVKPDKALTGSVRCRRGGGGVPGPSRKGATRVACPRGRGQDARVRRQGCRPKPRIGECCTRLPGARAGEGSAAISTMGPASGRSATGNLAGQAAVRVSGFGPTQATTASRRLSHGDELRGSGGTRTGVHFPGLAHLPGCAGACRVLVVPATE